QRAHRRWRPPRAASCCSIPFRAFPHLSRVVRNDLLGRGRRILGATSSFGKKRAETEARLGVPGLDKLGVLGREELWATLRYALRCDGNGQTVRSDKQVLVWVKPAASIIYHQGCSTLCSESI